MKMKVTILLVSLILLSVNFAVADDMAYLTAALTQEFSNLYVLDVSDPSRPRHLETMEISDFARRLSASEPYLFVAQKHSGLRIYDISSPEKPEMIAQHRTPAMLT